MYTIIKCFSFLALIFTLTACVNEKRMSHSTPIGSPTPIKSELVHPGMLSTLSQLNLMKTRYQNNDALTLEQVELMQQHVAKSKKIRNPSTQNSESGGGRFIYCGSFNKGKDKKTTVKACSWPAQDGVTAYTHALLGLITGDVKHSHKAIAFLDSWTNINNFKGFDPKGMNAELQHGWIIPWFANAAEILRYTSPEWTTTHTLQMNDFIKRMMVLVTADADLPPNNWMHARIEAHIAAAIWLDDKAELNKALNRWKKMSRSYFYMDSDNNQPITPEPTRLTIKEVRERLWSRVTYIEGASLETCRDINHESLGIRPIINSLTMAQAQNIDILSGNDNRQRLIAFFTFMPTVMDEIKRANTVLDNPNATKEEKSTALKTAQRPFNMCKKPMKNTPRKALHLDPKMRSYPMAYALLNNKHTPLKGLQKAINTTPSVKAAKWLQKWETLIASTLEPIK